MKFTQRVTRHWISGYVIYHLRLHRDRKLWSLPFKIFACLLLGTCVYIMMTIFFIGQRINYLNKRYGDVSNSSCNVPIIDPFDESISRYFVEFPSYDCHKDPWDYDLVYIDESGYCSFNETLFSRLSVAPVCVYESVERIDDNTVVYRRPIVMKLPQIVPVNMFKVVCKIRRHVIYSRVLATVFPDEKLIQKSSPVTIPPPSPSYKKSTHRFNVLILGVDSLSKIVALRKLPKTYSFMKTVLHGVQLNGFNQVYGNTYGNILPLLTGLSQWENPSRSEIVNKYNLIWKRYSERGYTTMFAEDRPTYISTFNYVGPGFKAEPVTHYMRPFWLAIEKEHPLKMKISPIILAFEHGVRLRPSSLCYRSSTNAKITLDYALQLFRRYPKNVPKFAFPFLSSPGHDHMNMIQILDDELYTFLRTLHKENHLDDTFVFFMGDHGHRFDYIRHTLVGQIELHKPHMMVSFPKAFHQPSGQYHDVYQKFITNQDRLTTFYDVHETLVDILHGNFNSMETKEKSSENSQARGTSIFQSIPESRTCNDASIPAEECACFHATPVNNSMVPLVAALIVNQINKYTLRYRNTCKKLTLKSIISSSILQPGRNLLDLDLESQYFFHSPVSHIFEYFSVSLLTHESNIVFSAIVMYRSSTSSMQIMGDVKTNTYVRKLNRHCISSLDITKRHYCVCY